MATLEERITDLERRIAALEGQPTSPADDQVGDDPDDEPDIDWDERREEEEAELAGT